MTSSTSLLQIERPSGKPPIMRAESIDDPGALRGLVTEHGALLVRGLGLGEIGAVEAVFRRLGTLMVETEAFAPRHKYVPGVYSASQWPPNQPMCVHHELSYALATPSVMLFACLVPSTRGGATPLADSAAVLDALPPDLVARFERVGWELIRNYNDDIGASLSEAFGTDDRDEIGRYCRANAITFEWQPGGGLRTWQRRSAVVRHPRTGRRCWFNQAAFLSEWTMVPEVRDYLIDEYGRDGLPFNTRFGDGEPIDADVVQVINETYESQTVREPWQAGDLLLVDNIRTAHGREPYEGRRDIVVALADPVRVTEA